MSERTEFAHELQRAAVHAMGNMFAIRLMSMGVELINQRGPHSSRKTKVISFIELAVAKDPDLLINIMKQMQRAG